MLRHVKPGDWAVLLSGIALTVWLGAAFWHGGTGQTLLVRSGGRVFAELSLNRDGSLSVPGPLGLTQVQVEKRRARIAADPSPRQYCVRQGWIAKPGEAAICLPNQVSIEIAGGASLYDTLNY